MACTAANASLSLLYFTHRLHRRIHRSGPSINSWIHLLAIAPPTLWAHGALAPKQAPKKQLSPEPLLPYQGRPTPSTPMPHPIIIIPLFLRQPHANKLRQNHPLRRLLRQLRGPSTSFVMMTTTTVTKTTTKTMTTTITPSALTMSTIAMSSLPCYSTPQALRTRQLPS